MSRYRVIKAYQQWSVGHVFTDMPGNVARTLMGRGLIEEVKADAAKPKTKAMKSPANRMMTAPVDRG